MILGTAGYMSPEQARGRAVDHRSDIWSFGCVLFELLSGKRAFDGDTVSDALASVLKVDPDLDQLPADTPVSIRQLLRRCLNKDAHHRLHAAADARIVIDDVLAGRDDGAGIASVTATPRRTEYSVGTPHEILYPVAPWSPVPQKLISKPTLKVTGGWYREARPYVGLGSI